MKPRVLVALVGALVAGFYFGGIIPARENEPLAASVRESASVDVQEKNQKGEEDAIRKASRDFVQAFEKGDAKALAALWTQQGEYHDGSGGMFRGRAELEAMFAEHFKEKPASKVEIQIESIRFLSNDTVIEDGLLRQVNAAPELPTSSLYTAVHVREGGLWKVAVSKEWGAGQDRLEDLQWLVGTWTAAAKDQGVTFTFTRDKSKPFLTGQFTTWGKDKVVHSGTIKIGIDPQRGQIRSWHFDDDGGHGQSLWLRDGNRWVLDAIGVMADGTPTAALNIFTRSSDNEFTFMSIDRMVGNAAVPDTVPTKLTRMLGSK